MVQKLYVIPDKDCNLCHGEGVVYDIVDYGSTTAKMPETCDCVAEQIPEEYDERELEYIDRSELDSLKKNWISDPCWDVYDTEGFELFRAELERFQNSWEREWEDERTNQLSRLSVKLGVPGNLELARYIERLEQRIIKLENAQ